MLTVSLGLLAELNTAGEPQMLEAARCTQPHILDLRKVRLLIFFIACSL